MIESVSYRQNPFKIAVLCAALGAALISLPVRAQDGAKAPAANATETPAPGAPLVTNKDKISYSTGVMTARTLMKNDVPFDAELIIQGLRDGMAGGPIRISEKELKAVLQAMQTDITRRMSNDRAFKAGAAKERGTVYQNEFKAKPGVVTLPGNLMYRVTKEGKGDKPGELSTVVVRYRGTFVDGTEFDATPEGKTSTVRLGDAILGWREILKRIPAGSTLEMVVPPAQAYGTRGAGNIGPNETLIFSVELVAVVQ
jgi:FKBP-type peptidyl-prolyl cis-trans isomerase FklB